MDRDKLIEAIRLAIAKYEKKCDIYDIRPEICRLFKCDTLNPFTMEEFVKQPIELQNAYLNLESKLPEVVSLREHVFGQKVPF